MREMMKKVINGLEVNFQPRAVATVKFAAQPTRKDLVAVQAVANEIGKVVRVEYPHEFEFCGWMDVSPAAAPIGSGIFRSPSGEYWGNDGSLWEATYRETLRREGDERETFRPDGWEVSEDTRAAIGTPVLVRVK